MNKTEKRSLFKASLLAGLLAAGLNVQAAGLGKLMVYSAIGQPLSAEVAITATAEELGSLSAKLAPHDAFREAGVEFSPALTGLRFSVVKQSGGQSLLKLTTDRPLNEPFLHFLIELSWTSGRMVREYTFLLDPPEMLQVAKPASVVSPAVPAGQPAQVVQTPAQSKERPLPGRVSVTEPAPAAAEGNQYRVKQGDTLGKIARETRLDSATLDQMLVALFSNNRDAFDGNNMNRLRAGKILRIPSASEAAGLDQKEAHKLVIGQAAEFNAYRRKLADAAGAAPVETSPPAQQASGKIKPKVEDKALPAPVNDKLEVSKTETGKASGVNDPRKALEEDLVARDKALREANVRIAELEKNLENLKKLVELKSQSGAQVQQQATQSVKPAEDIKPEVVPAKPAEVAAPAAKPVEPAPEKSVAEKPPEASAPTPAPVAATEKPIEKPAEMPPAETPKPAAKKPPPPPPPPPPPDFIEENPELVFGGGSLLALLLGYLGYSAWRKKKKAREADEFADQPSVSQSDLASKSGAMFGAASEAVGGSEVSIQGDFSETGVLTTEESVDPVAEADVLMAYGRDGQAEEILLEGLRNDPTREAIHVKLLELYANRGSTSQFEAVAAQLHQLSGGNGAEWAKAVEFAEKLGVAGGMFAGGTTTEPPSAEPADADDGTAEDHAATAIMPAADLSPAAPVEEPDDSLEFDLDLGTTSGPAMAAAAKNEEMAAAPAVDEAVSLDFDFDLGAPDVQAKVAEEVDAVDAQSAADDGNAIDFAIDDIAPAPVHEPAPSAAPSPGETSSSDIDFDFDMGMPVAGETEADAAEIPLEMPAVEPEPESSPVPETAENGEDFSFDLDLGSAPAADDVPRESVAEPALLSDVELPEAAPAVPEEVPAVVPEPPPVGLDLSGISLDLDEPEAPSPVPEASLSEPAFDLSLPDIELPGDAVLDDDGGLDLALDIDETPVAEGAGEGADDLEADVADVADAADVESIGEPDAEEGDNPEVATKLELAQAYEEMGDLEGARELLTEVLSEGSSAQKAVAQARLDQLKT